MMLGARSCTNFVWTLCRSKRKNPKAEKLLKTKDREGHFPAAKAENMLKTRQLLKGAGTRNGQDNMSGYDASLCRWGRIFK